MQKPEQLDYFPIKKVVNKPVEDCRAVVTNWGVTVKREQDVSLLTELTNKSFGLTALQTRLN